MSVLTKILEWSEKRPLWQRDALRRLLQQDHLSQSDIDELTKVCLHAHGISDESKTHPTPIPLSKEHIGNLAQAGARVQLTGVRDVRGVNALASGRTLGFASRGLTVVYGDNGSGKSGYTRILKTVCRARGSKAKIYNNIFENPTEVLPTAEIDYALEDSPLTHSWTDTVAGPNELGSISVFDTKCASVYVEDKTDVAFRPFGLDLFPRLVSACERVKASISASMAAQGGVRTFPEFDPETKVGQLVRSLTSKSASSSLRKLAVMSEEENTRLVELKRVVQELNSNDPRRRAAEMRLQAQRFRAILKHADAAERVLAEDKVLALRLAHEAKLATGEAARLAQSIAFDKEPLRGVGNDAWLVLWSAARTYSELYAYPGAVFPVAGEDAVCVFCQQPLAPAGKDRLNRFADFVKQEAQNAHANASKAISELLEPMRELTIVRESDANVLEELLAHNPSFYAAFKDYLAAMQKRVEQLRAACMSGSWGEVSHLEASPCDQLLSIIVALEKTVLQLDQAGEPHEAKSLRKEHAELLDRHKLGKMKEEVQAEIARQQRVAAQKAALKDTDTTGITNKNTELTKSEVTDGLRERFTDELKALDLRHLTVSVSPEHGTKGVMFHKVAFDDAKTKGWGVQDVLSEGEYRCIALASFLAELSMQPVASTIILDDPVSSLDHSRREYVARRLVLESKRRPVIVLTHDIVFLLLLQEQAESQQAAFTGWFLDREKGALGVPVEGLPWYGMPIKKRVSWLRNEVVRLRKTYKDDSRETYERDSAFLWGRLREAWECGVEEVLLNGAIKRFSRKISTQPLESVHDIEAADIAIVDEAMKACSAWLPGHDQSAALNVSQPHPDVFEDAVNSLHAWREVIIKRREKKKAG